MPKCLKTKQFSFWQQHKGSCTYYVITFGGPERPPPDMKFVKNFTQPDFQAKSFTPQKCVICDIFPANKKLKNL